MPTRPTTEEGEELLNCPFCGNPPRYLEAKAGFYTERVICDTCHFHLPPDCWNRRADVSGVKEGGNG